MNTTLEINSFSKVPKYRQVVDNILADIHLGKFKKGQKLPSINETSFEYLLSRDTVEKAYNELRNKGVIVSVRGKGYYINDTQCIGKKRVLLLLNKVSAYKKLIYTRFLSKLKGNALVDLKIHNGDLTLFNEFVQEDLGGFHYIIVLPQFDASDKDIATSLVNIPREKLILLDYEPHNFKHFNSSIYQDFERDIYSALKQDVSDFNKYDELELVFPISAQSSYPKEIKDGFRNFCFHHKFAFSITDKILEKRVKKGKLFLLISEDDLIETIKVCNKKKLKIGKDVGIISYNDNPMKEVLCEGINVVTTDFEMLTEQMASIVLNNESGRSANRFYYIKRNSV